MVFLIQTDLPGWQMASAMSRITSKVKNVICEQAPNHGSNFAYARLCFRKLSIYKTFKNSIDFFPAYGNINI